MFRLILVLALTASAYGYGRLVGGINTDIEKYNHQVTVRYHFNHICGGSLVAENVVATGAHCVYGHTSETNRFIIAAGSSYVKADKAVRKVKAIHQHGRYNPNTGDYDLAVLLLESPLELSDTIGVVKLAPRGYQIPVGTLGSVTGWGAIKEGHGIRNRLQVVTVPYIDWDDCNETYKEYHITNRMSCWGYTDGGKDACQGDSGGPLVIYNQDGIPQLAGIVSKSVGCGQPNYPGVYVDITNIELYDYIEQFL